jgi:hypothetical protein
VAGEGHPDDRQGRDEGGKVHLHSVRGEPVRAQDASSSLLDPVARATVGSTRAAPGTLPTTQKEKATFHAIPPGGDQSETPMRGNGIAGKWLASQPM